ncbi:hypothetical protein JCM3775_003225 [Rhodotorula graminis]
MTTDAQPGEQRKEIEQVQAEVESLNQLVASLSARLDRVDAARGRETVKAQKGAVNAALVDKAKPVVAEVQVQKPKVFDGSRSATTNDVYAFVAGITKAMADLARLDQLRQNGAAWLYAAKFRALAASLEITQETLKFYFRQGLDKDLKDALARQLERPGSFEALVDQVAQVDNHLNHRQLARQTRRR